MKPTLHLKAHACLFLVVLVLALAVACGKSPTATPTPTKEETPLPATPTATARPRTPTPTPVFTPTATPTSSPNPTPTSTRTPTPTLPPTATPIPEWFTGKALTIKLERIERTTEVRFQDGQVHYITKPAREGNELIAVLLDVRNTQPATAVIPINTQGLKLMDSRGDAHSLIDPLEHRTPVLSSHPAENRFLPFLWGTASLPQNCPGPGGGPQPCRLLGWIIFEVPAGRNLAQLAWQAGDTLTIPLSHFTISADPALLIQEKIKRVAQTIPSTRRLPFKEEVAPQWMTRQELTSFLKKEFEKPEFRQEVLEADELYTALGMIAGDLDLQNLVVEVLTEQVLGLFDLDTKQLYLVSGKSELSVLNQLTLAHEYVHALQQQHFDIAALVKSIRGQGDKELAINALIEGDATFAQLLFGLSEFGPDVVQQLTSVDDSSAFDQAPEVVKKVLLFPYQSGTEFVSSLFQRSGSWTSVDSAMQNPPISTEQVLHPQRYFEGETPLFVALPELAGALGTGWRQITGNVMGEFLLRTYLEYKLDAPAASQLAAGWGGDRYALLKGPQDQTVFVLVTKWDVAKEAEEFYKGYVQFADLGGPWQQRQVEATQAKWSRPGQQLYLAVKGQEVLIVQSPGQQELEAVLAALPNF